VSLGSDLLSIYDEVAKTRTRVTDVDYDSAEDDAEMMSVEEHCDTRGDESSAGSDCLVGASPALTSADTAAALQRVVR